MIRSNGVLVEEYWEPLLVLRSEQRQVAGLEQPSEQQLEGRRGYSGGSRRHLRRHRALIMGTHSSDLPPTAIRRTDTQPMDTEPTRRPAMDIQATQVLRVTPVPRPIVTRVVLGSLIPLPPATNTPITLVRRAMDHRAIWYTQLTLAQV